jgi:hypothetical protein
MSVESSLDRVALLLGLFAVPAVLLWAGHRLRRRSDRWRGAFWGAVLAHTAASVPAMVAALYPAAEWSAADRWRGVLAFWLMLLAAPVGAAVGAMRAHHRPSVEGPAPVRRERLPRERQPR